MPWRFKQVTFTFWNKEENVKWYLNWLFEKLGYTNIEDWANVTRNDFKNNYGCCLLYNKVWQGSVENLVTNMIGKVHFKKRTKQCYNQNLLIECMQRDGFETSLSDLKPITRDTQIIFRCQCGTECNKNFRRIEKVGGFCDVCTERKRIEQLISVNSKNKKADASQPKKNEFQQQAIVGLRYNEANPNIFKEHLTQLNNVGGSKIYSCSCGYTLDRDYHGARNICIKVLS